MILVFTGAGISKASGIDTFMEQPRIREKLFRDYARSNPEDYNQTIKDLYNVVVEAKPNAAHYAIAEKGCRVITMNIDGLHESAGSTDVVALHGTLPTAAELDYAYTLKNKPVLYGDMAPNYDIAIDLVESLGINDIFLVIGASHHTQIAVALRQIAHNRGAMVIEIQSDAEHEVPKVLNQLV